MSRLFCTVALLLTVFVFANAKFRRTHRLGRHKEGGFLGAKTLEERQLGDDPHVSIFNFTQKLDHFDPQNTQTFDQKVWVNNKWFKAGGPAFINIGGEGPTSRHWIDTTDGTVDWLKNAEKFNALCFQFEHRYYGDTHPTPDMSVKNLKWLSSRQALADIANFIEGMNKKYNLPETQTWVTFGGSYSGALSAWFRLKYPHLVVGAIATSGPVQATLDFKEYLGVVKNSLHTYSAQCEVNVAAGTAHVEELLKTPTGIKTLSDKLGLCSPLNISNPLDVSNFYSQLAGTFMGIVQYSQDNRGSAANNLTIPHACALMLNTSVSDVFDRYINVQKLVMAVNGEPCFDFSYEEEVKELQDTSWNAGSAARAWIYQSCTEFGYFQSSDLADQPFGHDFDGKFSQRICSDVFGPQYSMTFSAKAVNDTNNYYGGRDLQANNVVLPNGSVDPWHALGVLSSDNPLSPAVYMTGTAHCANMYPPRDEDVPDLLEARKVITAFLQTWLA